MRSFTAFLVDMGPRPSDKRSVGRIDNDKGYCPSNCRWETDDQQANNKKSNFRVVFLGRDMTTAQVSEEVGIPARILRYRLRAGMTIEGAIAKPIRKFPLHPFNGKLLTCRQIAAESGINYGTLKYRIKSRGMSVDEAISEHFKSEK